MRIVSLCIFAAFTVSIYSQPVIEWQRCYGGSAEEEGRCIRQTSDGGYVVVGYTNSVDGDVSNSHGSDDMWVIKIDAVGALQWEHSYGGSSVEYAAAVIETADGGYAVIGTSRSTDGDVTGYHGGSGDFWVIRLTSTGDLIWQRCLGGSNLDLGITITENESTGDFLVAGSSGSYDGDVQNYIGSDDFWLVKLNSAGSIIWRDNIGGTGLDNLSAMAPTSDSGWILAGTTISYDGDVIGLHNPGASFSDFWVVKLNPAGAILWRRCIGGSVWDEAYGVIQTSDLGYIVIGSTGSDDGDVSGNHGSSDYSVVRLSASGIVEWQTCLGGSSSDGGRSVIETASGYVVGGYTNSDDGDISSPLGSRDGWIALLGMDGTLLWEKCLGGSASDEIQSLFETSDGGFIATGSTLSNDEQVSGNNGVVDLWVVKFMGGSSAIAEAPSETLISAPNPANEVSLLTWSTPTVSSILQLIDPIGREILRTVVSGTAYSLDVSKLTHGRYAIILNYTDGSYERGNILVQ